MQKVIFIIVLCCLLICSSIVFAADEKPVNPSFFGCAELVDQIPPLWGADIDTVAAHMEKYEDMHCTTYPDTGEDTSQIVCESLNNRRTEQVVINFWFWGDFGGRNGLQTAVFTLGTSTSARVQDVLEWYRLSRSYPDHRDEDVFYDPMISLFFRDETTFIRYDLPQYSIEGLDYTIVDMRPINGE